MTSHLKGAHKIARGSFASVFQILSCANGERRALKILHSDSESTSRWFERCACVTKSLNHPHILPCLESNRIDGHCYTIMPFVDCVDLRELAGRDPLPPNAEVFRILRGIADALDYAHGLGVIHGDVHPNHVLLDRTGHVWLIGFSELVIGLPEEMVFGNPHHLAPEQFDNRKATLQTDIYALAEIAFLLLSGSFPFAQMPVRELLIRKRSGPVPSLREHLQHIPHEVDLTLQRAMAVRPADRHRSANQFVNKLHDAMHNAEKGGDGGRFDSNA